jgi:hypothetical protein
MPNEMVRITAASHCLLRRRDMGMKDVSLISDCRKCRCRARPRPLSVFTDCKEFAFCGRSLKEPLGRTGGRGKGGVGGKGRKRCFGVSVDGVSVRKNPQSAPANG